MKPLFLLLTLICGLSYFESAYAQTSPAPQVVRIVPDSIVIDHSPNAPRQLIAVTFRNCDFYTFYPSINIPFPHCKPGNIHYGQDFYVPPFYRGDFVSFDTRINDSTLGLYLNPVEIDTGLLTSYFDIRFEFRTLSWPQDTINLSINKGFKVVNPYHHPNYTVTPAFAAPGQTLDVLVSGLMTRHSQSSPTVHPDFWPRFYKRGGVPIVTNFSETVGQSAVRANFTVPAYTPPGSYDMVVRDGYYDTIYHFPAIGQVNVGYGPHFNCQNLNDAFTISSTVVDRPARVHGKVYNGGENCQYDQYGKIENILIEAQPGPHYAISDGLGYYDMVLPYGNYTIKQHFQDGYVNSCKDTSYSITLNAANPEYYGADFLDTLFRETDVSIDYIDVGRVRPGLSGYLSASVLRRGTFEQSLTVDVTVADSMQVISTNPPSTRINANTFRFFPEFTRLSVDRLPLTIQYVLSPFVLSNRRVSYCAQIVDYSRDANIYNNGLCGERHVTNSFDPNDKSVSPAGDLTPSDSVLTYTIRFQNTGTDTAFTVIVRDTLSEHLDMGSIRMLASSHRCVMTLKGAHEAEWRFSNINLLDSNRNEPASHGFVTFSIQKKKGLPLGTRIDNRAGIYFDFNAVVLTNTVSSLLANPTAARPATVQAGVVLYPNPVGKNAGSIRVLAGSIDVDGAMLELVDPLGRRLKGSAIRNGKADLGRELAKGLYRYRILKAGKTVAEGNLAVE